MINTLKKSKEFELVFKKSKIFKQINIPIVLYVHYISNLTPPQYGIIISRKIGQAVYRNKLRRRLKHFIVNDFINTNKSIIIKLLPHKGNISYKLLKQYFIELFQRSGTN